MTLLVAVFGGLGAALRFVVDGIVNARRRTHAPLGSFVVNVLGSFLLGLVAGLWTQASDDWRLLLGTGFCGGFTTFSTAMLESARLAHEGRHRDASMLLLGTLVVSLSAAMAGLWLAS